MIDQGAGGRSLVVLGEPNPVGVMFTTVIVLSLTCKLLEVIHVVANVVTANAFFIDWEQVLCCDLMGTFNVLGCYDLVGSSVTDAFNARSRLSSCVKMMLILLQQTEQSWDVESS